MTIAAVALFALGGLLIASWLLEVWAIAGLEWNLAAWAKSVGVPDYETFAAEPWSDGFHVASKWSLAGVLPAVVAGWLLLRGTPGGRWTGLALCSATLIVMTLELLRVRVIGFRYDTYDPHFVRPKTLGDLLLRSSDFAVPGWYVVGFLVLVAVEIGVALLCVVILSAPRLVMTDGEVARWVR